MSYTSSELAGHNVPYKGKRYWVICILGLTFLPACSDKYEEGFQVGYAQGARDAEVKVRAELEQKINALEREKSSSTSSYSSTTSTEVCGGSGVNLNGKHYSGGKTGCVKVFSDGRVEKY